jgi:hypothetical protein
MAAQAQLVRQRDTATSAIVFGWPEGAKSVTGKRTFGDFGAAES